MPQLDEEKYSFSQFLKISLEKARKQIIKQEILSYQDQNLISTLQINCYNCLTIHWQIYLTYKKNYIYVANNSVKIWRRIINSLTTANNIKSKCIHLNRLHFPTNGLLQQLSFLNTVLNIYDYIILHNQFKLLKYCFRDKYELRLKLRAFNRQDINIDKFKSRLQSLFIKAYIQQIISNIDVLLYINQQNQYYLKVKPIKQRMSLNSEENLKPSSELAFTRLKQTSFVSYFQKKGEKKKIGDWSDSEARQYVKFIQNNLKIFKDQKLRRKKKIFQRMAEKMRTRSAAQCRSHHQKMEQKWNGLDQLLAYWNNKMAEKAELTKLKDTSILDQQLQITKTEQKDDFIDEQHSASTQIRVEQNFEEEYCGQTMQELKQLKIVQQIENSSYKSLFDILLEPFRTN